MKKIIVLILVVTLLWVVWNRQRLFVRDPLAFVTKNGTREAGAQIFINYSNDVLIENDNPPMYILLVQHDQHIGLPAMLKCLHFMVCLTDADVATLLKVNEGGAVESMTGKTVVFHDAAADEVVVTLH